MLKKPKITAEDVKQVLDEVFQKLDDVETIEEMTSRIIMNASRLLSSEDMDEVLRYLDSLTQRKTEKLKSKERWKGGFRGLMTPVG
jgi:polyhydroxyalkanoate synthesis regulator phasin